MKNKNIIATRKQLDRTLRVFSGAAGVPVPAKGWIRAVRESLGMTALQLARRLGLSQPRISRLEKDELSGSVTLHSMKQAAAAMDCVFVYAIVPRESLESLVREKAEQVARKRLSRVSHTVQLEDQGLAADESQDILDELMESLIRESLKKLWEE